MIDLHAHTTVSDGTVSPKELIQIAKETGLSAIALTDHDSIYGLDEAQHEADKLGITFVKGIEFSASYGKNRLIHILGLGIDPRNEIFMEIYTSYKEIRAANLNHVFSKLNNMGVNIKREDVEPFVLDGYIDRQAVAKYLIARGYAALIKEAWINYLDYIPYLSEELMSPEEAINAIHAAGGKAFLAHFHMPIGLKGYSDEEARRRLEELKGWGLDGMEYYYPSYTDEDTLRCAGYIKDFDFIKSGGTDFHGANRAHIKLGIGEGNFEVPEKLLKNILPKAGVSL